MGRKILVVDDEQVVREVVGRILEKDGHEVLLCASGEEALALLSREPDLVILDICMPGMDGLTVLRRLKAVTPHVPVIMVTGMQEKAQVKSAMESGASDFIMKPFQWDRFRQTVSMHLEAPPGQ